MLTFNENTLKLMMGLRPCEVDAGDQLYPSPQGLRICDFKLQPLIILGVASNNSYQRVVENSCAFQLKYTVLDKGR